MIAIEWIFNYRHIVCNLKLKCGKLLKTTNNQKSICGASLVHLILPKCLFSFTSYQNVDFADSVIFTSYQNVDSTVQIYSHSHLTKMLIQQPSFTFTLHQNVDSTVQIYSHSHLTKMLIQQPSFTSTLHQNVDSLDSFSFASYQNVDSTRVHF